MMNERTQTSGKKQSSSDTVSARLMELASSYTSDWKPDLENPDGGTVIAEIYGQLYGENQEKYRTVRKNFAIELANILGVGLKQALPAQTTAAFQLAEETVDGIYIPKNTKLQAQSDSGESIIFQTSADLYATSSKIKDILFSSQIQGKIYWMLDEERGVKKDIVYGIDDQTYDNTSAFFMEHPYGFHFFQGQEVTLDFAGENGSVNLMLSDRQRFRWHYETREGWKEFCWWEGSREGILLHVQEESQPFLNEGKPLYRICCRAVKPVKEEVYISRVFLREKSSPLPADSVWTGDIQQKEDKFWPFGNLLSLHSVCSIACDRVMTKKGASVTMEFDLSFDTVLNDPVLPAELEFKPVMKKPAAVNTSPKDVLAEEVILEYFNGTGWCRLSGKGIKDDLFADARERHVVLEFLCPEDGEAIAVNAGKALWLRMRLLRAEGCYLSNTRHHAPVIQKLTMAYDSVLKLNGQTALRREFEFCTWDERQAFTDEDTIPVFSPVSLWGEHLLLGFERNFNGGPISLEFAMDGSSPANGERILMAGYSTAALEKSFSRLDIVDFTEGLSHWGKIEFTPPEDFCERELYGKRRCWLSLSLEECGIPSAQRVSISQILTNSVDVVNLETLPAKYFYADGDVREHQFYLGSGNLVAVKVEVNEAPALSQSQMTAILKERKENVDYAADRLGNITEFFVEWKEQESFLYSQRDERHFVVDRVKNILIFPDGKNGKSLPGHRDAELRVTVSVCRGEDGNVDAGAVSQAYEDIPFISSVTNSRAASGGCHMEELDMALKRASGLLLRKNRIVTVDDLEQEIEQAFTNILRVKYMSSRSAEPGDDRGLLAVLMKDWDQTDLSFWEIRDRIAVMIQDRGQFLLRGRIPDILPPVRISIHSRLEIQLENPRERGMVYQSILNAAEKFINPVSGNFDGRGWEIGMLPQPEQLQLYLRAVNRGWSVKSVLLTGVVETPSGKRELDIPLKQTAPDVMAVSGKHQIKWAT